MSILDIFKKKKQPPPATNDTTGDAKARIICVNCKHPKSAHTNITYITAQTWGGGDTQTVLICPTAVFNAS